MLEVKIFSRESVISVMDQLKHCGFGEARIEAKFNDTNYSLLLLTKECSDNREMMELLGRWRKENEIWYASQFEITVERTIHWFINGIIQKHDRLSFIIEVNDNYIGHVGLNRFNYDDQTCEIDNILRGEKKYPGIIGDAIMRMMIWGKDVLKLNGYTLKVLGYHERAIKLYNRLGFKKNGEIPLIQIEGNDGLEWTAAPDEYSGPVSRHLDVMELKDLSKSG